MDGDAGADVALYVWRAGRCGRDHLCPREKWDELQVRVGGSWVAARVEHCLSRLVRRELPSANEVHQNRGHGQNVYVVND